MRDRRIRIRFWSLIGSLAVAAQLCGDPVRVGASDLAPELLLPLGHSGHVSCVALSGDGKLALTGSYDKTAILWDVDTARAIHTFTHDGLAITSVALSADGTRALVGSERTLILWKTTTGRRIQRIARDAPMTRASMSEDGARVLVGFPDTTAILWDTDTAREIQTFKGHTGGVKAVALCSEAHRVLTGSIDKTAMMWDADSGRPIQVFKGHTGAVHKVALSSDGKRALTYSYDDGKTILWDTETGKPLRTLPYVGLESLCFSRDGRSFLLSGIGRVTVWDTGSSTTGPRRVYVGSAANGSFCAAFSARGTEVLVGSFRYGAVLWDVATGKPVRTLKGRLSSIRSLSVTSDGRRAITGYWDRSATFWDIESGRPIRSFNNQSAVTRSEMETSRLRQALKGASENIDCVALVSDGENFLTGSGGGKAVLWEIKSAWPRRTFAGHASRVSSCALSGDGNRALTGDSAGTAILWDVETSAIVQTFKAHTGDIGSVAMSADGTRVLTGSWDGAALWDTRTGNRIQRYKFNDSSVLSAGLSADGRRVVTSSAQSVLLWEAATGRLIRTLEGHKDQVKAVTLSRDSERVLTGSDDGSVMLWEAETGRPIQRFAGHTGDVVGVAFDASGSLMFTASGDGTLRVWTPGREDPIAAFTEIGMEWLAWTPEGYYACSPNGESLVAWKVYGDFPGGYRIVGPDQFRKRFYRPDLFAYLFRERDLARALAKADAATGRGGSAVATIASAQPPVVAIIKPDRDVEIGEERITIESLAFSVGDHPVARMRLLVDGRPYQGNLGSFEVPKPALGKVRWSKVIDLDPGEHTIQVIAESISEGRSDVIRIRRKAVALNLPKLYVLAAGVSAYEKEALRKDVFYAAADAQVCGHDRAVE